MAKILVEDPEGNTRVPFLRGILTRTLTPEVDLEALSDDTRQLLTIGLVFTGLLGLYLLWSPVLPALRRALDRS